MKKWLVVLVAAVMISSGFFGHSLMNTMAGEGRSPKINRYYTSVEISQGDTLWSLASQYTKNSGMNTKDYVRELKSMNNLKEDTIHTGQYLTIVYFSED